MRGFAKSLVQILSRIHPFSTVAGFEIILLARYRPARPGRAWPGIAGNDSAWLVARQDQFWMGMLYIADILVGIHQQVGGSFGGRYTACNFLRPAESLVDIEVLLHSFW